MGNFSGEIAKIVEESEFEILSFERIYFYCLLKGFACAFYRLPNSDTVHVIIDCSSGRKTDQLQLDEIGKGFIFHPFLKEEHPAIFINGDIHITENIGSGKTKILYAKSGIEPLKNLRDLYKGPDRSSHPVYHKKIHVKKSTQEQKDAFTSLVNKTIGEIGKGTFHKAVIARNKIIDLPDHFNTFDLFNSLIEQYRNAFVYLTYIPDVGSWIGATPEMLIQIDRERQFKTVALAATQAKKANKNIEDFTWSQKDIEEQAMVSRYIINCFKKIRLREFEEVGPRTYLSGNLVHLKTDYNVDMEQVGFPQLGTVMLDLLHPTSAVCGMPKETAMSFIQNNEDFDREYFAGFLGPINMQHETNIFVNLRCMKILERKASLFAGAGIISNSTPEKEWNETEIKMETILKVLRELY